MAVKSRGSFQINPQILVAFNMLKILVIDVNNNNLSLLINIVLHFFTFTHTSFAFNHLGIFIRSSQRFISITLAPVAQITVSSAYNGTLEKLRYCLISFIYMINRSGPRIEPWGTPRLIQLGSDTTFLI